VKTEDFEQMYEKVRPKAVQVAAKICGDGAEDAVSDAALWCLENLEGFKTITTSYFLQLVAKRARDYTPREHGASWLWRENSVGHTDELALLESQQMPNRERDPFMGGSGGGRRTPPVPRAE